MNAEEYLERIENKRLNSTPLYSRDEMIFFAKKYAEHYHTEQLNLPVVVRQSEQLFCECAQAKGCDIDEDGHLYCIECQKNIAAK